MKEQQKRISFQSGKSAKKQGLRLLWKVLVLCVLVIAAGILLQNRGFGALRKNNADQYAALRINEVQSVNVFTYLAENGEAPDWIELKNTGDDPVSLKGCYLALGDQVNRLYPMPDLRLGAGDYLIVFADGNTALNSENELHAPFKLPASGGVILRLMDESGKTLDSVLIPEMQADESYCRISDDEWKISEQPTLGVSNSSAARGTRELQASAGALEISEAMPNNSGYFPDENGDCWDYIEIHNISSMEINLQGYHLSDDAANLNKWEFPEIQLPIDGYLALHCSGLNITGNAAHLHANFRISNEGEVLYLSAPDGELISKVSVPALQCGQAYSLQGGAWTTQMAATPNLPNTPEAAQTADSVDTSRPSGVILSEIMAIPTEQSHDWIELYNPGDTDVDLSGCGLSNDLSRPRKWQFPNGTRIGARDYLLVVCTGDEDTQVSGYICAPFGLAAAGGYTVCLSQPDGTLLDCLYLPRQSGGVSYGRNAQGRSGYLRNATPLAANDSAVYAGIAEKAVCSVEGGLFAAGDVLSVELRAEAGASIYYTLDCSDPTQSSLRYDGAPISISSTTILRTRVYMDGRMPSDVDTQSYLYDVNGAGEVPYVISLVSDPHNLYDYNDGIMVMGPNAEKKFPYGSNGRGANFWMDWERESHIEFFTDDGSTAIAQECGIKIHGRNSRAYDIKPIKVIARAQYGEDKFYYPIFSDREYGDYKAFILREAGQDQTYAFMRDVVFTSLAEDTTVMYQEAEEGVCYINGEYYSAVYVREHMSPYAICRYNGWEGDEDKIDLVKGSAMVMHGSNDDFAALEEWLKSHDTSSQEAYEKIDSAVDIDNFIEYISIQLMVGTPDTINVKRYRNTNADGKWRWILYDVDRCMREDIDSFALLAEGSYQTLFKACMNNPTIRDRFLKHFNAQMASALSAQTMVEKIHDQYLAIEPILPEYLDKMDISRSRYTSNLKDLVGRVEKRPTEVLKHCQDYLNLSDSEMAAYFKDAFAAIESYVRNF